MIRGRYLVVQMLGQGANGDVYLAVDQRDGIAVAVKRVYVGPESVSSGTFDREAVALTRLNHPVLPRVKEHFVENGIYFLVMEHVSGEHLANRLEAAKKPFPINWVMFWADQLLDALNYLHSHVPPIFHGDMNLSNLKLTPDNHIVLLDLGLSAGVNRNSDKPTMEGASPAIRHFPSPEQLRGAKTEAGGDLYSLSASLYQLATNTVPVDPMQRVDGISSKGSDPLLSPAQLNGEVNPAVANVIVKGMALRSTERFTSAVEMQQELRQAFNAATSPKGAETAILPMDVPGTATSGSVATHATEPNVRTFDATVKMDANAVPVPPKQSDVKTEVFQVHETDANRTAAPPPSPLSTPAAEAVDQAPPPHHVTPDPYPSQVTQVASAPKKRSKAGLFVGVAGGLLLLAVVAAGGVVFVYKTYFDKPVAEVSPTPPPTATPTPEEVIASEQPIDTVDEPTPEAIQTPEESEPANTRVSATPAPNAPTAPPKVTVRTTPAGTTKPQAPRATPKPPPARDDRTVILQ